VDTTTVDKWLKVKLALENANKTDTDYYKRACAVAKTGKDPGPFQLT
jgi:hypothetical protein